MRRLPLALSALLLICALPASGRGAERRVRPEEGLAAALAEAKAGDVLRLAPGHYRGGVRITTPGLTLEGEAGAVIEGGGRGTVITIAAPGVTLRHLTITGSGTDILAKEAGVFVGQGADRARIAENVLTGNGVGLYLDGAADVSVEHNRIEGLRVPRIEERGPGVELANTPGSRIIGNEFLYGRDGVFSVTSARNEVSGNRFRDLRFAVHFMYTNASVVKDNISTHNVVGYAMMFSDHLVLEGNVSDGDRDEGLLFNYANGSLIEGNVVRGAETCVFIYDAAKNRFSDNWFEGCGIGVHFTAGSERNVIAGNSFVSNRTQVKYVGTRFLDWSENGRGNYWSDNPAFDLSGRGVADAAYRPNGLVDQAMWRAPSAKYLLASPAIMVLRWAEAAFPALHPGGVVDTAPLMEPVKPKALGLLAGAEAAGAGAGAEGAEAEKESGR
jgi:nitrous oxidase accessory protein